MFLDELIAVDVRDHGELQVCRNWRLVDSLARHDTGLSPRFVVVSDLGKDSLYCATSRLVAALEPVLPNPAGSLRIHGFAFGALKRLAELLEVLDGAIHAHPFD
jgi:hypothetical protein